MVECGRIPQAKIAEAKSAEANGRDADANVRIDCVHRLDQTITQAELNDLMSYLRSLK